MNEMPYKDKKGNIYKYGEFFPAELSPFFYNETTAQEYFPLTKEAPLVKSKFLDETTVKSNILLVQETNNVDTKTTIMAEVILLFMFNLLLLI